MMNIHGTLRQPLALDSWMMNMSRCCSLASWALVNKAMRQDVLAGGIPYSTNIPGEVRELLSPEVFLLISTSSGAAALII